MRTMTAATTEQQHAGGAYTILQRCVCLTLEIHFLGNERRVALDALVEAAGGRKADDVGGEGDGEARKVDEKQVRVGKRLLDTKRLNPAMSVFGRAKQYLRSRAVAAHRIFGERSYLVPSGMVGEVHRQLSEYAAELKAAAEKLADEYEQAVAEQAVALGPLFNHRDYKTKEEVRSAWVLDWSYVSFAAPDNLETVDRALFKSAQQKYEGKMAEAYDEVKLVLRETLRQLTAEIVRKLQPGEDGKPRQFRNTVLDGLADFLQTFELRNVTDDRELGQVVKRLRGLTKGLDVEQLREADAVRNGVLAEMQAAAAKLDGMVGTTVRRGISFGPPAA